MRIRGASLAVAFGATFLAAAALAQQGSAPSPNPAMTPKGLSINQWGQPCVPVAEAKESAETAAPAGRVITGGRAFTGGPQRPRVPGLPAPDVRMRVVAPGPQGAWLLRIDNEGSHTVRIPADARLLQLEVDPLEKGKRRVTCALPAPLRPERFPDERALYLQPGQSYVEPFDPQLYCFGKTASAALQGGALVRPVFGFRPRGGRGNEPFAVDSIEFPSPIAALEQIAGPTLLLSHGAPAKAAQVGIPGAPSARPPEAASGMERLREPAEASTQGGAEGPSVAPRDGASRVAPAPAATPASPAAPRAPAPAGVAPAPGPQNAGRGAGADAPIFDEKAPRLALTAEPFSEASRPARATVTVTARNLGRRAMRVLLRPRMMAFRIEGPDGLMMCDPSENEHAPPPDVFSTLGPGATRSITVLLDEVCPDFALRRPGLYRITPSVHALEAGDENVRAWTGVATAQRPMLLRLLTGPLPFHARPPRAVPTASLEPRGEADEPQ